MRVAHLFAVLVTAPFAIVRAWEWTRSSASSACADPGDRTR
jgi:hypothetical protein